MIDIGSNVKINNPMSGFNNLEGRVEEIHEDPFKKKPNGEPIILATVAINFPTAKGYATVREIFPVDFLLLDKEVSDLSEGKQAKTPVDLSEDKEAPVCCICGKKIRELYDFNSPEGAIDTDGRIIEWTDDAKCCASCNMTHVILGRMLYGRIQRGDKQVDPRMHNCGLDRSRLNKKFLIDGSEADLSESYRDDDIVIYNLEGLFDYQRVLNQVIKDVEDYIDNTWDYGFLEIDQDEYDSPQELEKKVHEEATTYAKDFISEVDLMGYKGELVDWKKSNVPGEYMDTIQNARYFVQYKNGDIYIGDEDSVTVSNIIEAATGHKLNDRIAEKFNGLGYLRDGQEYIDKLTYGEKVDLSEDLDGLNKYLKIKDDDKVSDEDFVRAIAVVGPKYLGGKYPPFNKYAINESSIPHVMRYKEWDCWEDYNPSDDALHIVLDWTTQEDFTKEQLDDFKAEVCRCIRELLKYHNIEDTISLDLRARSRNNRQKTFRYKLLIYGNKLDIDLSEGK